MLTASYEDAPAREERDGLRIVRLPAATVPRSRLSVSFDIAFTARAGRLPVGVGGAGGVPART